MPRSRDCPAGMDWPVVLNLQEFACDLFRQLDILLVEGMEGSGKLEASFLIEDSGRFTSRSTCAQYSWGEQVSGSELPRFAYECLWRRILPVRQRPNVYWAVAATASRPDRSWWECPAVAVLRAIHLPDVLCCSASRPLSVFFGGAGLGQAHRSSANLWPECAPPCVAGVLFWQLSELEGSRHVSCRSRSRKSWPSRRTEPSSQESTRSRGWGKKCHEVSLLLGISETGAKSKNGRFPCTACLDQGLVIVSSRNRRASKLRCPPRPKPQSPLDLRRM